MHDTIIKPVISTSQSPKERIRKHITNKSPARAKRIDCEVIKKQVKEVDVVDSYKVAIFPRC